MFVHNLHKLRWRFKSSDSTDQSKETYGCGRWSSHYSWGLGSGVCRVLAPAISTDIMVWWVGRFDVKTDHVSNKIYVTNLFRRTTSNVEPRDLQWPVFALLRDQFLHPPWPVFAAPAQKRCRHGQFFRGGSFVDFGGEKEERKEGGKFVCLALGGIVAASTDATWR